jgi:hypothetical protein
MLSPPPPLAPITKPAVPCDQHTFTDHVHTPLTFSLYVLNTVFPSASSSQSTPPPQSLFFTDSRRTFYVFTGLGTPAILPDCFCRSSRLLEANDGTAL